MIFFRFTRINPRSNDYDYLLSLSDKHGAVIVFRTVLQSIKDHFTLMGFITFDDDLPKQIHTLLPNFMVEEIKDGSKKQEWIESFNEDDYLIVGPIYTSGPKNENSKRSVLIDKDSSGG